MTPFFLPGFSLGKTSQPPFNSSMRRATVIIISQNIFSKLPNQQRNRNFSFYLFTYLSLFFWDRSLLEIFALKIVKIIAIKLFIGVLTFKKKDLMPLLPNPISPLPFYLSFTFLFLPLPLSWIFIPLSRGTGPTHFSGWGYPTWLVHPWMTKIYLRLRNDVIFYICVQGGKFFVIIKV